MWRAAASRLLLSRRPSSPAAATAARTARNLCRFSPRTPQPSPVAEAEFTPAEARRMVRLVGLEVLKRRLWSREDEVVPYAEFLDACVDAGAAPTRGQAEALAGAMDESGSVVLFRGKVYLHPEKVADLIRRAVPFALAPEDDARKEEFRQLQAKMQEIDGMACRHAVRILWVGLASFVLQFAFFFRLTFWEFSWHVIEPLAYSLAGFHLIFCYGYFLRTASNPTLQDFKRRLFLARRRKLCTKLSFDMDRYLKLQKHSGVPPLGDY